MQPRVLERDRGVIGRGAEHLDLFPLEYPPRNVPDGEDPDRGVVVEERDREHRANRRLAGLAPGHPGIGEEVGRGQETPVVQRPRLDRTEPGSREVVGGLEPAGAGDGDEPEAVVGQLEERGPRAAEEQQQRVDDLAAERGDVE